MNITLRTLAGLAGIALLLVYFWKPEWVAWAALPLPGALRWLGAVVGAGGIAGLIWLHRELGRNVCATLAIRADQVLVTAGHYRWVRHPMYTTLFLIVFCYRRTG